jgi:hypothetical protein
MNNAFLREQDKNGLVVPRIHHSNTQTLVHTKKVLCIFSVIVMRYFNSVQKNIFVNEEENASCIHKRITEGNKTFVGFED